MATSKTSLKNNNIGVLDYHISFTANIQYIHQIEPHASLSQLTVWTHHLTFCADVAVPNQLSTCAFAPLGFPRWCAGGSPAIHESQSPRVSLPCHPTQHKIPFISTVHKLHSNLLSILTIHSLKALSLLVPINTHTSTMAKREWVVVLLTGSLKTLTRVRKMVSVLRSVPSSQ